MIKYLRKRSRSRALVRWWNKRSVIVQQDIDSAKPKERLDHIFRWTQLIWQELQMFVALGEQVGFDDLEYLTKARGFSKMQRLFLIEGVTHLGLGRKLTYNGKVPKIKRRPLGQVKDLSKASA